MNNFHFKIKNVYMVCVVVSILQSGCQKLIKIDEPVNTLTTAEVFSNDAAATSAMAGVYSVMINGLDASSVTAGSGFSQGLSTQLSALSSDELYSYRGPSDSYYQYNTNHVTSLNAGGSNLLWQSAYDIIYKSNSIIEGLAASKAPALHDSVRNELTGEAKFIRAFSYFYLVNFFGDVPMALTIDFNKTQNLPRMPQAQVYQQIIQDLKDAQAALSADYSAGHGERIIPNKWAATLLLARVYLYTGDNADAALQATALINNVSLFGLEPDLNNVFSTTSREAVWQLKQTTTDPGLKNATPEGNNFLPYPLTTGKALYCLTGQLLSAFEPGDLRRSRWVGSTDNSYQQTVSQGITYYPYKYTIGSGNGDPAQPPPQYYTILRLAEAYLIRAEAETNGAAGGSVAAIVDLNIIRTRAGLPNLANGTDVKAAAAKENQIEFFAEWGHRWFDLKRSRQAHSTLSVISLKQPWAGDYQLLYPIPLKEITADHFLTQNQGY